MKKSDQFAAYFLYDLDKIRVFIELSERHWNEESTKYNESDLEADESTYWDRYKYRNDLSAHFDSIFPQYQKQSYLVMLVSLFEDYLNQFCYSLYLERSLCCELKDYKGKGIERAKTYLTKIALVKVPTKTKFWQRIIEARELRNIVAHNAGHLDEELHKRHFKIVNGNKHLESEKFARVHLNIKQSYLVEIIDAMENFTKEMSINLKNA
ncbi:hypothetical protein [Pseudoalteromonas sp. C8]|uniref:hypothetical protein n=1 Tax=Pseudoalteromonas sp. C8 TaxID=2686345 RepID=UPI0013FDA1B5|nr:hypothetical protein [Pseudoalteromonas sp. C8]